MNAEIYLLLFGGLMTVGMITVFIVVIVKVSKAGARPPGDAGDASGRGGGAHGFPDAAATATPDILAPQQVPPDKIILRGLQDLLTRDPDEAFVIFEHPATESFVQFRRHGDGLLLDRPALNLKPDQLRRAKAFFGERGGRLANDAGPRHAFESFELNLPADPQQAARVAMEIFEQVFRLPRDFRLYVKTEQ